MSNAYIAHLQENYKEVLPTPARLKGGVIRLEKNVGDRVLWKTRSPAGRPFQVEGLSTETLLLQQ